MKAAIYCRTSTKEKQDLDTQRLPLRRFCAARKWGTPVEYVEQISSGKKSRPELTKLLDACRKREVDVVVVQRFDRAARSLRELVTMLDELHALDVEFVSMNEQVDTSTPAGRALFQMIGAFAEFERSIIKERVVQGVANARAKGKTLGRPRTFLDAGTIEEVRRRRDRGDSLRKVSKALKLKLWAVRSACEKIPAQKHRPAAA